MVLSSSPSSHHDNNDEGGSTTSTTQTGVVAGSTASTITTTTMVMMTLPHHHDDDDDDDDEKDGYSSSCWSCHNRNQHQHQHRRFTTTTSTTLTDRKQQRRTVPPLPVTGLMLLLLMTLLVSLHPPLLPVVVASVVVDDNNEVDIDVDVGDTATTVVNNDWMMLSEINGSEIREWADYDLEPVPWPRKKKRTTKNNNNRNSSSHPLTTRRSLSESSMTLIDHHHSGHGSGSGHGMDRSLQGGPPRDLGIRYGVLYTDDGYDRESGQNPVCWVNEAPPIGYNGSTSRGGGTIDRFSFQALPNHHFVLSTCPTNVSLSAHLVDPYLGDEEGILRTNITYEFNVQATIDLTEFPDYPTSNTQYDQYDDGIVAILCILCDPLLCGLCTPYTHSQATSRLRAMNVSRPWSYSWGERHGGTHVHSGEYGIQPNGYPNNTQSDQTFVDIDVNIPFQVNEEGSFYGICSLQFITVNDTNLTHPAYAWDIANVVDENLQSLLYFKHPMEILKVSSAIEIISICIIGIVAFVQSILFVYTIVKYDNQVLHICQGKFLSAFLLASICATISSFLWNPKNDWYCQWQSPTLLIPLQFMVATLAGLIWRVKAVISPILMTQRHVSQGNTNNNGGLFSMCTKLACCFGTGPNNADRPVVGRNIRKQVTEGQLCRLILLLTMPQIIVQALSLAFGPQHLMLFKNEERTKGRLQCSIDGDEIYEIGWWYLGLGIFTVTSLFMLIMAFQSRQLPSILNSAKTIFDAIVSTLSVVIVGIFVLVLTSIDPEITPDISYMILVLLILTFCSNLSLRIILPKLVLVWRGEKIIVSKLVAASGYSKASTSMYSQNDEVSGLETTSRFDNRATDYSISRISENKYNAGDASERSFRHASRSNVSSEHDSANHLAADSSPSMGKQLQPPEASAAAKDKIVKFSADVTSDAEEDGKIVEESESGDVVSDLPMNGDNTTQEAAVGSTSDSRTVCPATGQVINSASNDNNTGNIRDDKNNRNGNGGNGNGGVKSPHTKRKQPRLLLRMGHAPPSKLMTEMVQMADLLSKVNGRLLSGFEASEQDWETIRDTSEGLSRLLSKEVQFEWEKEGHSNNNGNNV